jgi:hypothetical protein
MSTAEAVVEKVVKRASPRKTHTLGELENMNTKNKLFEFLPGQLPAGKSRYNYTHPRPPEGIIIPYRVSKIGDTCSKLEAYNLTKKEEVYNYFDRGYKVYEIKRKSKELSALFAEKKEELCRNTIRYNKYHNYIGADPEIFCVDADSNLIPAFEVFTKRPCDVAFPYWDGYQAEYTTVPENCMAYFFDSVRTGLHNTRKALRKKFPGANLTLRNTFEIPPERLQNDKEEYVAFGCKPSFSVYGETFPQENPRTVPFRSAGGHMHFSLDEEHRKYIPEIVKALDSVLGVIAVSMFQYYDDPRRRIMYGRAGEYRTPKHGLEYRVLSNAWLCHPAIGHFVFELARLIMGQAIKNYSHKFDEWVASEEEVRKCINECDVSLAHNILKRNEYVLNLLLDCVPAIADAAVNIPPHIRNSSTYEAARAPWRNMIYQGIDKFLTNPDYPSSAWSLSGTWLTHSSNDRGCMATTIKTWGETNKLD